MSSTGPSILSKTDPGRFVYSSVAASRIKSAQNTDITVSEYPNFDMFSLLPQHHHDMIQAHEATKRCCLTNKAVHCSTINSRCFGFQYIHDAAFVFTSFLVATADSCPPLSRGLPRPPYASGGSPAPPTAGPASPRPRSRPISILTKTCYT